MISCHDVAARTTGMREPDDGASEKPPAGSSLVVPFVKSDWLGAPAGAETSSPGA